jgi:hypothetical protein
MYIRLTRKLAQTLNGLDLRSFSVGELINLDDHLARMLIAEGWAERVVRDEFATADDRSARRRKRIPRRRS